MAHDLIVQTAIGAAVMLRDSGEHPVKLREAVTSPAGTTINAIRELENHGVRAALLAALEAARDRSRELASGADVALVGLSRKIDATLVVAPRERRRLDRFPAIFLQPLSTGDPHMIRRCCHCHGDASTRWYSVP